MKKLLITLCGAMALTNAFAQQNNTTVYQASPKAAPGVVTEQSLSASLSLNNGFSLLYLHDGLNSSYSAVSYKLYSLPVSGLSINALGSYASTKNMYLGTGLSYDLVNSKGVKVTLIGGLKGLSLTNLNFASGRSGVVFGIGLTIPIGTKN